MNIKRQQPCFDTVTESVQWLQGRGYDANLSFEQDRIVSQADRFDPDDFLLDYVFRFEGESDPNDEDIVFGVSSVKWDIKGILVSAFGAYAGNASNEVIARLVVRE